MARRPIADGLFTWPDDDPRLIGGRCGVCETYTFPAKTGCPKCGATDVETCRLGRFGTLWTWTSQGFIPKQPFSGTFFSAEPFEPWFVGLIEIPGQLRLESILTGCTQETLRMGMPMRLVVLPFSRTNIDDEIVTFAFAPIEGDATPREEQGRALRA